MRPTISIVIATFNSEKTLELALNSLKNQTYPPKEVEILILDGGSTDRTLKIAEKYPCRIVSNPCTEPVYGKFLGYKKARGKYVMYLDADEVLVRRDSIEKKIKVFRENSNVKAVIPAGYKSPEPYPFVTQYINEFGDPFSFFIYRLSKDYRFFIPTMRRRFPLFREEKDYLIFAFDKVKSLPIIELVAGGSMFDAEYLKKTSPQTISKKELLPHYFYLLLSKYPYLGIVKTDVLVHYSSDSWRKYLAKIQWRVKNNIYFVSSMGESGFTGREVYLSVFDRFKKFLFIPYAFTIVFPTLDSLYLMLTRKRLKYFLHIPLTMFTAALIVLHYLLRLFGYMPALRSYDETKEVGS